MKYLSKVIVALMLCYTSVAFSEAFKDDAIGVTFPKQLGKLRFYQQHQYPQKELGYSLRYSNDKLKVDVFVYNKDFTNLEEGANSSKVSDEFEKMVSEILIMEKYGAYSDVKRLGKEIKSIGSHQFLWGKYQYYQHKGTDYPGMRISQTYLTVKTGSFVKVRITLPMSEFEEKEQEINEFIKALAKALYPEKQVMLWQK